jgi:hypothetical protein
MMGEVIAGPAGHWYALEGSELVGLPIEGDDDALGYLPPHPSVDPEGWYASEQPAPGVDVDRLKRQLGAD